MALIATIVLIVILSGVGFWFFKGWLASYASDVSTKAQQAETSSSDITTLQRLKTQLEQDSVAVNRTKNIVADSKSYEYQNQIVTDLSTYAKNSGITIESYSFDAGTSAAGAAAPTAGATPAPAGLKTTKVSITISNPVKYDTAMRFIHSIELNLTKMQLAGVSLHKDTGASDNFVTLDPLTVEVYIR